MHFERILPQIVAGYLIIIGLFFGFASAFQTPFIVIQPPGKFFVLGISIVFVASGVGSFYLLHKGKLKQEGTSISEVRQDAIEKMKDPELLSRIAIKDSDSELRESAQERLKEISETN